MRIHVINPNTGAAMTESIGRAARRVAAPGTEIVALHPDAGPESIESHVDEAFAAVGVLELVRRGELLGADGYVIACFGDPGLLAARELAKGPVLGIAEAAFHAASMLAGRFSVVTTLARTVPIAEHRLLACGLDRRCARVRAAEIPVLELETPAAYARIADECRRARDEDGIGALVLGCGGMAEWAPELGRELGLPVVDGVTAAVKFVESLVALGLGTGKLGDGAYPPPKRYTGRFSDWTTTAC